MPRIVCCFAVLAASLFSVSSASAADDPQAGKALVYTCGGCHGVPGYRNAYPNYHVPRIAGQNYDYLVAALTEYKKGERAHPTMRAQGEGMSDQDMHNIAAYLSSLTP
jgi:cytochrome c553